MGVGVGVGLGVGVGAIEASDNAWDAHRREPECGRVYDAV